MLCACSGEQFKFDEPAPQSPESLATRDFSASGLSSITRNLDWESKLEDAQVDEAESTLKEALSLNYEEARALLGRLEYQRGNFDAALQVFQGIDIRTLSSRMSNAIAERTQPRKSRSKGENVLAAGMSLHSVSLLLEAILLKAKSLEELGRVKEAARECKMILDIVESAFPYGIRQSINEDFKLVEMFHKALELLPKLWIQSGFLDEAITAYRRALVKPWYMDPQRLAKVQKDLAALLLYGGVETSLPSQFKAWGLAFPTNNMEESILLLFVLMWRILYGEIEWDPEVMDHLTFALTISGQFEYLADHVEQVLPGIYNRAERWYFLALCYSAAGQYETALNLLKKVSGSSEAKCKPHLASFMLGAKLCAEDPKQARQGINFARRVIDVSINQNEHLLGQAHKFLGVCYGNAARMSISDSERMSFHRESLNSLNHASSVGTKDPEIKFNIGLENAIQRNLASAFDNAMLYSDMMATGSERGWKLLALILSAEQRLKDSEAIVDLALDESGSIHQLELLRLKAVLQIAQEQPKQAIETYRILLSLIQAQRELFEKNTNYEALAERKLEVESWLDLAGLYSDLKSWHDAAICIDKAKLTEMYSHRCWHTTAKLFQVQAKYKEAIIALSVSLSIEPDYVPSIVLTAEVLLKMGHEYPIARSFLMNALRLEPTNHNAWFKLGLIYKMEGSMQQAVDCFQAAHELKLSAPVQSFK
ncbi:no pollen germination related 1 [Abeliophyllum distichum]|uniref:No pollen germination related 1 n=1 Tax=Abeliophyllum distichum TaxID=126358 RepID=A0ABD1SZH3_9LAMI